MDTLKQLEAAFLEAEQNLKAANRALTEAERAHRLAFDRWMVANRALTVYRLKQERNHDDRP